MKSIDSLDTSQEISKIEVVEETEEERLYNILRARHSFKYADDNDFEGEIDKSSIDSFSKEYYLLQQTRKQEG